MAALTHFPKTRLSELVGRLGGISRSDAVAKAKAQLETMRGQADAVIGDSMTALEEIVYSPTVGSGYTPEQMRDILCLGDQIVTLAGTFGYDALDKATRSLCDISDGLAQSRNNETAPIQVHLGAMRMVVPGAPALSPEHIEKLLSELAKIKDKYGIAGLSEAATGTAGDYAAGATPR